MPCKPSFIKTVLLFIYFLIYWANNSYKDSVWRLCLNNYFIKLHQSNQYHFHFRSALQLVSHNAQVITHHEVVFFWNGNCGCTTCKLTALRKSNTTLVLPPTFLQDLTPSSLLPAMLSTFPFLKSIFLIFCEFYALQFANTFELLNIKGHFMQS